MDELGRLVETFAWRPAYVAKGFVTNGVAMPFASIRQHEILWSCAVIVRPLEGSFKASKARHFIDNLVLVTLEEVINGISIFLQSPKAPTTPH
jgi:hypothetical protein